MIPDILVSEIERVVNINQDGDHKAGRARPLGGGSINDACMIEVGHVPYFIKWNSRSRYPGMFEAEAHGLQLLTSTKTLRIPQLMAVGSCGNYSYLLLEYIHSGRPAAAGWDEFGRKLAALHRNTNSFFGLDRNNYIGSLPQHNMPQHDSWPAFFVQCRLLPQLQMAVRNGLINSSMQRQFEHLFNRMDTLFPKEPPSLLHGDLWSGNYLFSAGGEACLIDPAVYYGHREMDLAMSLLFGGFDQRFYQAYHEAWPLEPGWRERVNLCNLYPLMVHVNLFGGAYLSQVRSSLNRFA
ncbi:MAG TPA: fructosamine kinase family protein [Bacteroidales bacterium]|nr:fructosamine kinase family protein [Bacteroidales bacterium]